LPNAIAISSAQSEAAETTSSLKQLADAFGQSDLRALVGPASGAKRVGVVIPTALSINVIPSTRPGQESRKRAGTLIEGQAHNLTVVIDVTGINQVQGGVRRNKGVEVGHSTVLPEEGTAVSVRIIRSTDYLAFVIHPEGPARHIPRQRAEVLHTALYGPEKSVKDGVARQVGLTDNLTSVIDGERKVVCHASKAAQVNHGPVLPEHDASGD
jgi:hypothetical protein